MDGPHLRQRLCRSFIFPRLHDAVQSGCDRQSDWLQEEQPIRHKDLCCLMQMMQILAVSMCRDPAHKTCIN